MLITTLRVTTRRMRYEVPIVSKFTILRGMSATGKSTLIQALIQHNSKIDLFLPVKALPIDMGNPVRYKDYLDVVYEEPTLLYGDEDLTYLATTEFQEAAKESKHLFLLVTRNKLAGIPYSYKDIWKLETKGKTTQAVRMYDQQPSVISFKNIRSLWVEDSKSGLKFFESVVPNTQTTNGKNNIPKFLRTLMNTAFVADDVGFGSVIEESLAALEELRGNKLYLIPSFEALIYYSSFCRGDQSPDVFCKNKEAFFEQTLHAFMQQHGRSYSKSSDLLCFTQNCCCFKKRCKLYMDGCKQRLILGEMYDEFLKIAEAVGQAESKKSISVSKPTSAFDNL